MTYPRINKLKYFIISDPYEIMFSRFVKNVNEWTVNKHIV